MMKKILFLLVIFSLKVHGQKLYDLEQDRKNNLHQVYSTEHLLLPHFVTGYVFIGSDTIKIRLNYDVYTDEMLFIDWRGDTLALSRPEKIDAIKVDKKFFRYVNNSYVEVLASNEKKQPQHIELYIKRTMIPSHRKRDGVLGILTDPSATKSIQSLEFHKPLELSEHTIFKRYNSFYIHIGSKSMKANRKAFFKAFPYAEKQLELYLKDNRVKYNNGDDLIRMFYYCVNAEPVKGNKKKNTKVPQKSHP